MAKKMTKKERLEYEKKIQEIVDDTIEEMKKWRNEEMKKEKSNKEGG